MITKTPMHVFRLNVHCEECKEVLKFIGEGKLKVGFIHKCPKCDKEEYLDRQFPCLTFEVAENIQIGPVVQ